MLSLWAIVSAFAHADEEYEPYDFDQIFGDALTETEFRLRALNGPTSMTYCDSAALNRTPARKRPALESCRRSYLDFYTNPTLDVRFALGYQDSLPQVSDRHMQANIEARLTRPCSAESSMLCGFAGDPDDADVLTKTIPGPDGQPRVVRLTITHSSATEDDATNCPTRTATGVCNPTTAQAARSARSSDNFINGIRNADAVFYFGHARAGGGPDFDPPILDADGHTNYPLYQSRHDDRDRMVDALRASRTSGRGAKFLGLFACSSTEHFSKDALAAGREGMGFVGTGDATQREDNLSSAMGALDSLLAMRCQEDFSRAIRSPARSRNHQLSGFFR